MGRKTYEQVLAFGKWPYGNKSVIILSSYEIHPVRDNTSRWRLDVSICARFGVQSYGVPAPTRSVTGPRTRPTNERIPSVILGSWMLHPVRDRAAPAAIRRLIGVSGASAHVPLLGSAPDPVRGDSVTGAVAAPVGTPRRIPVVVLPNALPDGTIRGIPCNASES